ncbi:alpha-E domain-containing protein [Maribellus comscasis]|uniref:Alpha-E domain-containing protein n=1 Tax=Maribellus comscasis TaxID=2681766 RepID=A0A6I6JSA3_9BACT|nr:alpha-E domain-containing protein [Maribellus comscasis]QGY43032.1 alpha-E domain-containing protein [Maribellus comscasis]
MLSRAAENLFWMGRYLERTEHLARYINVEYFSSLDSSHPKQHELALLSIADMIGFPVPEMGENINEEEVLVAAALDDNNPVSIVSAVFMARENARSVRDAISTELWEAINNFYHFIANYPVDIYKTKGLSDFTYNVIGSCSNVRGRIQYTLLYNVGWYFIQLGLFLESASQVVRIMISKLNDINEISKLKIGDAIHEREWDVLLDCVEAKDMCNKYYTSIPNRQNTIEFLLFNKSFPRSVVNRLDMALDCISKISPEHSLNKKSLHFKVAKIITPFQYMDVDEIDDKLTEFLEDLLSKIYLISDLIADEYFK